MWSRYISLIIFLFAAADGIANTVPSSVLLGGETTVFNRSRNAFGKPATNLPVTALRRFTFGNRLFNTQWISAPASVDSFDGLGPLFNRNSCSGCHFKDGRGHPPETIDEPMQSMLVRLSTVDESGAAIPHPTYGSQFNPQAILGFPAEGKVRIQYTEIEGVFPDGEAYTLHQPEYHFDNLSFGELGEETLFSGRVAPAVYGLGLLEAIPDAKILEMADRYDSDRDGISGRVNWVKEKPSGQKAIGRFGWKGSQPSLKQQAAVAFLSDIGITSSLMPEENWNFKDDQKGAPISGGQPELSDDFLDKITFYLQTLAVPAQRNWDQSEVLRGKALFLKVGCGKCHHPEFKTGSHPVTALSDQQIFPYTNLLLHDMGDGLADNRPEFGANGREWRTAPLWGIGLVPVVNGHTNFLHDGRARNLQEAILWHGGEADPARLNFMQLSKQERAAIISFLESL